MGGRVMRQTISLGRSVILLSLIVLGFSVALAQDRKLEELGKANRNFGMDVETLRKHFGDAFRPRPSVRPATTAGDVIDRISEIRLFHTPDPNLVRAELAIAGASSVGEITLDLEQGPTRFTDDGSAPDSKKADGVFTAM
jgi:hypothetical protein